MIFIKQKKTRRVLQSARVPGGFFSGFVSLPMPVTWNDRLFDPVLATGSEQ